MAEAIAYSTAEQQYFKSNQGRPIRQFSRNSDRPHPKSTTRARIESDYRYRRHVRDLLPAKKDTNRPSQDGTIIEFTRKIDETAESNFFYTGQWLREEVERSKEQPIEPGETPWYALPGTGFRTKEQAAQLVRNARSAAGFITFEVLDLELGRVGVDIRAFEDEYLKQMLSLRYNIKWREQRGQKKLICPDYGNSALESVTDKKEREGAVYEALFGDPQTGNQGVEKWLRTAPANSFAVIVSPQGWSGLLDAAGNKIIYPETQIYVFKTTEGGGLQARTFRYKANIFQNEDLQKKLGLAVDLQSDQKERIKKTLKNVAFIKPDDADKAERMGKKGVRKFEDVVDLMRESVGGRDEAYEGKSFSEIYAFLKNPEAFSKRHPLTGPLIRRFQDYARLELLRNKPATELEDDLQRAMAITVLQLNKLYREQEKQKVYDSAKGDAASFRNPEINSGSSESAMLSQLQRNMNYHSETQELQKRPGCAGGGSKTTVDSMGTSRSAEILKSREYEFDHEGTCVSCHSGPKALGPCNICEPCVQQIEFMDDLKKKTANDNEETKSASFKKTA